MSAVDNPAFSRVLAEHFPGAVTDRAFLESSVRLLAAEGFTSSNTLAGVAICRDEIAHPLLVDAEAFWGPVFSLASLAGLLTAGRTGMSAAAGHIPVEDGRRHFVLYAMAHIAIGADGAVGVVSRPGLPQASKACGALAAFRSELLAGELSISIDHLDLEQSFLKLRLLPLIRYGSVPSLVALTKLAADAIEADLWEIFRGLMDGSEVPAVTHGAFFTGIQIHGPGGVNYIWPRSGQLEINGEPTELDLTAPLG
jgi:hypothetical protein